MKNEITVTESKRLGERYYHVVHKSGLPIYVFPKKMSATYAVFATRYGSVDNRFRLSGDDSFTAVPDGIAHFLEHKMFESENGEDAFVRYSRTGASANAFTSNLQTAYLFSCTENFDASLEILLDFVTHPYFTEKTVQKEQGIIGQEITMYLDNPSSRLYHELLNAMYRDNKVRISVEGTRESISHITADILYRCHAVFYQPSNMVLSVCGDVTPEQVLAVADRVLPAAEGRTIERDPEDGNEPREVFKRRAEVRLAVAKPIFAIGVKDCGVPGDPHERCRRYAAVRILCDLLFSESGAFYNELYDSGVITSGFNYFFESTQAYSFIALVNDADDPELVYERFVSYIEEVKKSGIDREDFERCKRINYAAAVRGFNSTESIAHDIVDSVFDGAELFDHIAAIDEVTPEYVEKLLGEIFSEDEYAMSVVRPLDEKERNVL